MTEKEVGELRRRFKQDRGNISRIRGCYVNTSGEIITGIDIAVNLLPLDEQEKYLDLLKKVLSGTFGKNLEDIVFKTSQVVDSPEHKLLTALRTSGISDDEAVDKLFSTIAGSLKLETNYLILLAYDCYDVPYKSSDGVMQYDAGDTQHRYIVCSICPVKETNAVLHYDAAKMAFHDRGVDWVVFPPELGFTFPAFDDRATNIYGALYYSRSSDENHEELTDALFNVKSQPALNTRRENFGEVLTTSLEKDCSAQVVQSVHTQLHRLVAEHKEAKIPDRLSITRETVSNLLKDCGISEERLTAFDEKFDAAFGEESEFSPISLMNDRQLEYRTPDVVIKVNPDRSDLISTKVIDGARYILINAGEGVEINGVNVHINE